MNIPTFTQQIDSVRSTLAQVKIKDRTTAKQMELILQQLVVLELIHKAEVKNG